MLLSIILATAQVLLVNPVIDISGKPIEQNAEVPTPTTLDPKWWTYFSSVEGKELEARVQNFLTRMKEYEKILSPEAKKAYQGLIEKTIVNLQAYEKLKSQKVEEVSPAPFKESYTIQQQVDVATNIRKVETQLQSESRELQLLKNRSDAIREHIDDTMASYLNIDENTPEKLKAGLDIMSSQAALGVTEQKIRLLEKKTENIHSQLENLKNELIYARKHTQHGNLDLNKIKEKISEIEQEFEERKKEALSAELDAIGVFTEDRIGRTKSHLMADYALNADLAESIVKVDLIFQKTLLGIGELAQNVKGFDLSKMKQQVDKWEENLDHIKTSLAEWKIKSNEELERLGSKVSPEEEAKLGAEYRDVQKKRYQTVQQIMANIESLDRKIFATSVILEDFNQMIVNRQSNLVSLYYYIYDGLYKCCSNLFGWYYKTIFKIGGVPISISSLIDMLFVIFVAYLIGVVLRIVVIKLSKRHGRITKGTLFLINRIITYFFIIVGIFLAISVIGLDVSTIFILLGALSVGIGFGLQSIVNNFVSSLVILFSRNVNIGDYIELSTGIWGQIEDVNVQNTTIRTWDGIDVVVPNSQLISQEFHNWTMRDPFMRFHVPFSVAYGTDKELVEKAAVEAAMNVECTISSHPTLAPPKIWFTKFGDSALEFDLVVWVNMYGVQGRKGSVISTYLWEIDNTLKKYNITVPFPQRDLHIKE